MRRSTTTISRWLKNQSKLVAGISAGVIIGAAGSAVVLASIPDGNGVIHGCRRTNGGALSVIDDATQTCAGNETALNWNQTGPQGPAGVAGATGSQGPVGPQGPAGSGPGSFLSNLVGADFTNGRLQYLDFSGVDMHNGIFNGAWLTGSDFSNANLSSSTFEPITINAGWRLVNTNFSGADFSSSSISTAFSKATGAVFNNADFSNATISGGGNNDLTGAVFNGAIFAGANFDGTLQGGNFTGASFTNSILNNIVFVSTDFAGINFTQTNLPANPPGDRGFKQSNLSGSNFSGLIINSTGFRDGNNMAGANFSNAQFVDSDLSGSNFSNATLTGATWTNTICPDGTNSNDDGDTCTGHLTP